MNLFSRRRRDYDSDEVTPPGTRHNVARGTHGEHGNGTAAHHSTTHGAFDNDRSGYHMDDHQGVHTNGRNPVSTGDRHATPLNDSHGINTSNHHGPLSHDRHATHTNGYHGDYTNDRHDIHGDNRYDNRYNDGRYNDNHYNTQRNDRHTTHNRGGFFSRFNKATKPRKQQKQRKQRASRPLFDIDSGNFNRRPSFGQWLKFTWLDLLTMAAMGAVGLGVYNADPAPSRSFPITFNDGEVVYPQFAYPLRNEIVPIWLAALLASLIPIFIILCMQIRIRSFWDVNNAIIGLLYSLICAAVFQVFVKWLIGGMRPHFLVVCDPDPAIVSAAQGSGNGFQNIMFDRSICRGDRNQINDALESMPSGHSTAAFAGFMFLYFYLNAKLKVFSNYHPAMWKLLAVYAPVLGATLIAGAMTIDEFHHWYDVLMGAVIGTVMAASAYRMVYASLFDFRFNHVPLTRHTPFSFGAGPAGAGGFESSVFSRKAGWGYEEAYGGAPFDAAYHLRDQVAGFNTTVHPGAGKEGSGLSNGHGNDHGFGSGRDHKPGDVEHNAATATAARGGTGILNGNRSNVTDSTHHHHSGTGPLTGNRHNVSDSTNHRTSPGMMTEGRANATDGPLHHGSGPETTTTNRGGADWGYPEGAGEPDRYRQHRKSIERKALPTVPT
ncbi:uncharacterized protein HMPREF1541_01981 [Cyphellophora europaea CBS 101466]|uniref:Phosphatidic acid phosphatase type 2/haloperoxidase domain-containing protein n=1 Tax=Cyphellophora europaea (strain CBS 101466) TaxID=1220924 RepID=W2S442_CYPE1|nr:uncharacterized protein HMPREF1541_01981 [Cyphellophora europaea CBS 101466]ETN42823.1 hypothetical protein HMPREF1541_01981 [Cyphellophora europaea CBS 101466]